MSRSVVPELLDSLAVDDPTAMRSRRDLQRVHQAMGTRGILLQAFADFRIERRSGPLRILELGAGDGSLMLSVARAMQPSWAPVELTLLDCQDLIDAPMIANYVRLGWLANARVCDVHHWATEMILASACGKPPARWDLIVVNLFLHHFDRDSLCRLLSAVAASSERSLPVNRVAHEFLWRPVS